MSFTKVGQKHREGFVSAQHKHRFFNYSIFEVVCSRTMGRQTPPEMNPKRGQIRYIEVTLSPDPFLLVRI